MMFILVQYRLARTAGKFEVEKWKWEKMEAKFREKVKDLSRNRT